MITRRDVAVAMVAVLVTACAIAVAQQKTQGSTVFAWDSIAATPTPSGSIRRFFKGPTATLDDLDIHVTTLNPGQWPHPPHQHVNEELLIVKEGALEFFVNGEWRKAGTGSVVFIASNEPHTVRNPGSAPATIHVIAWTPRHN